MIKNERQYRITKARLDDFEQAIAKSSAEAVMPANAELRALERAATESQLQSMREEVAEYQSLLSGLQTVLRVESFDQLPRVLIGARIAAGMTQRDLAEKLGLKEQQVQRYEATDYASASLATLQRVVNALGLHIRKDVLLPNADLSLKSLWRRLEEAGLPRQLIVNRILPRQLCAAMEDPDVGVDDAGLAIRIAAAIGRIFGFAPVTLFEDKPTVLAGAAGALARFKVSASADATKLSAYAVYAHYLAILALDTAAASPTRSMPETASAFRSEVQKSYPSFTFHNALRFAWDCGVVVLPLSDSGAFHGACWRVRDRHVIVLKQRNQTISRWFYDLLHEIRHTVQEANDSEFSVIEGEETSQERRKSKFERDADHFAANVLLDGRAKELARRCEELSRGSVERLKSVVPQVAREAGVGVGALANYIAFVLSLHDTADWWGAATNLQPKEPNPWKIARDIFLERTDLGRLNSADRDLLARALSSPDEVS